MAKPTGECSGGGYHQPPTIHIHSQDRCRVHPKPGDALATGTWWFRNITRPKHIRICAAGVACLAILTSNGVIVLEPGSLLPRNAGPAPLERIGENTWQSAEPSSADEPLQTCG